MDPKNYVAQHRDNHYDRTMTKNNFLIKMYKKSNNKYLRLLNLNHNRECHALPGY